MLKHKGKGKSLAALLLAALILMPSMTANTYAADSGVIHEEINSQTITQGVTLDNIIRFTTDGWYNFHVLKVDMTNQYISVDTLTNKDSVGRTATTTKLAAQRNAVAAVNASFFTSSGSGNGFPVGAIVQSSDIMCAYNSFNKYGNVMSTFSIDNLNQVILDYWKIDMSLSSPKGSVLPVEQYNVANKARYTDLNVFDKKWGKVAVGVSTDMPDIFQMVVVNGVVTQFLNAQPAAPIPDNGFVVVTRTDGAAKLQQAFVIGDAITMNIGSTPDWTKLKMAVSGSSMLVKDGAIPATFSFNADDVKIKSPKTSIGSSKDGKTIYFVTVDGRQTSSIGLTQKDMALFMKGIGAYNAINMDGGGSTTMVARPLGSETVKVMNKPSDGTTRNVLIGIGVFTSAPAAPLAGLIVETTDHYLFANASRAFTIKGLDKFNNPINVDPASVKWSASGVKGTFKDNVFRPSTFGEGKVTAEVGTVTASINISVLSKPSVIMLSTNSFKLPAGQSKTFTVKGVNSRGYTATIEPSDITWKVSNKIGTFKDGVFTATNGGVGYIDASFGSVHAYCGASISNDSVSVIDNFEVENGSFVSYPETVAGSYTLSAEQKISGNSSGKLVYDFTTNTDITRAAYLVLKDGGYTLDAGTSKIGFQVYNDHGNPGWLRAELYDANGDKQVLDLTKTMDWTGWKYIDASVEDIKMPAKLTRIYQVLVDPDSEQLSDAGCLYLDDLTVTKSGYTSLDGLKVPEDTLFPDEANIAVSFGKATSDSFRFGVLGQSRKPANTIEKNLAKIFADKVTKLLDVGAIVGDGSHESITSLIKKKPVIATHTVDLKSTKAADYKYSSTDIKNSRFIKLDTRNNSLRKSDSGQWFQFLDDLNSFKGKNLFIFMEDSPETFTDKLELDYFKKTLNDYRFNTLRNVWVFYNGDKNKSYMEKGVRYIESAGYEVDGLKAGKTAAAKYVLVTVKGNLVTYIYKEIGS
jgi:exopolysaccharide biosynthesis protein